MQKQAAAQTGKGLSPLARGNLGFLEMGHHRAGSIPARAGEPSGNGWAGGGQGVYPRSRGGTYPKNSTPLPCRGLSPLARGNRRVSADFWAFTGSIPARAGEPAVEDVGLLFGRVYPRSRGGTHAAMAWSACSRGLSPLARGNHSGVKGRQREQGSIPARAGEPSRQSMRLPTGRVYPRSRGGTFAQELAEGLLVGLSPLARGNPQQSPGSPPAWGSIPARAGEPLLTWRQSSAVRVYPRSRGGTSDGLQCR